MGTLDVCSSIFVSLFFFLKWLDSLLRLQRTHPTTITTSTTTVKGAHCSSARIRRVELPFRLGWRKRCTGRVASASAVDSRCRVASEIHPAVPIDRVGREAVWARPSGVVQNVVVRRHGEHGRAAEQAVGALYFVCVSSS